MRYAHPGTEGAKVSFKSRYGNNIGGEFVPPVKGEYFTNTSPLDGQPRPHDGPAPPKQKFACLGGVSGTRNHSVMRSSPR